MRILQVRNVCEALHTGLEFILTCGVREDSRAGPVIVLPWPLTTVYERPTERVLFSPVRDANPFFHLYESMWMLAGLDDARMLETFVRDFGKFAETGGVMHGAYGRRWRSALGFDQLDYVVKELRKNPQSRQCVIQMWDAQMPFENGSHDYPGSTAKEDWHGSDDLRGTWKDRPCNTHVYLRVRDDAVQPHADRPEKWETVRVLDLTVCCRSNDMVLGGWGANAVHFSVLQEYLAVRIGVQVGRMYQVSNNAHVYVSELNRLETRKERLGLPNLADDRYADGTVDASRMFYDSARIDQDVEKFIRSAVGADGLPYGNEEFFGMTLTRAMVAHSYYRSGNMDRALDMARYIHAPDWRAACVEWLERKIVQPKVDSQDRRVFGGADGPDPENQKGA